MIEEKKKSLQLTLKNLCAVYNFLHETGQTRFPLYQEQISRLESIVKTVEADYFGVVRFPDSQLKAAAYFYLIIKNHPVVDGNKRLAVLWLEVFCEIMGITIQLPQGLTLDILAVSVEKTKMPPDEIVPIVQSILF